MAISYTPELLSPATRGVNFSMSISFSGDEDETVTSVVATLEGEQDEIVITSSSSSFTVSGKYISGWQDVFTYVEAGESDKTDTPKSAINIANMPDQKNLYDLAQDQTESIIRTYNVTVEYDSLVGPGGSSTFSIPHQVNNNLDAMKIFMAEYNYNNSK